MPPFQSRSTSASRIARISSAGVIELTPSSIESAARTCVVIGMLFAERG